ncbi:MAG: hypothetical protein RX316_10805, partial [bacterium]|nr:hypothetical protein [bacterium]
HDANTTPIIQHLQPFTATAQWTNISVTKVAPAGTNFVTIAIVGQAGGTVLFDDTLVILPYLIQGDVTRDGLVDWRDIAKYGQQWLAAGCAPDDWCSFTDLDQSTTVNLKDIALTSAKWQKGLPDILGVSHVDGKYYFGAEDFLNEGADRIGDLGSRVIKVWFHRVDEKYPWNSSWPVMNNLVEQAQAPYFQELFAKHFTTFVLLAQTEVSSFGDGMTAQEILDEQQEFYNLTTYLLNTYQNTGKTFILQHWEGDWLIRNGSYDPEVDPTPTAIAGMIDWLNARQAGVDQARAEFTGSGVKVYHAAEVNIVVKSMNQGKPNVINAVLPFTNCDMVSYSAWDSTTGGNIGNPEVLRNALDFIAQNMPDNNDFGDKNVYLGEFGLPENDYTQNQLETAVTQDTQTALQWGCQYVLYWQLYCNELVSGTPPISNNSDVRGFWLIKPDGSYAWTWDYFYNLLNPQF